MNLLISLAARGGITIYWSSGSVPKGLGTVNNLFVLTKTYILKHTNQVSSRIYKAINKLVTGPVHEGVCPKKS